MAVRSLERSRLVRIESEDHRMYPAGLEKPFSAEPLVESVKKAERFAWMNESTEASIPRESWFGRFWQKYVAIPAEMAWRKMLVADAGQLSVKEEKPYGN